MIIIIITVLIIAIITIIVIIITIMMSIIVMFHPISWWFHCDWTFFLQDNAAEVTGNELSECCRSVEWSEVFWFPGRMDR